MDDTHDASKGLFFLSFFLSFVSVAICLLNSGRRWLAIIYQWACHVRTLQLQFIQLKTFGGILDKNVSPFSRSYNKINAFMGQRLLDIETYTTFVQRSNERRNIKTNEVCGGDLFRIFLELISYIFLMPDRKKKEKKIRLY